MPEEIPTELRPYLPAVGSVWIFEPFNETRRCHVRVTAIRPASPDLTVYAETLTEAPNIPVGATYLITLVRWFEACVLVGPDPIRP